MDSDICPHCSFRIVRSMSFWFRVAKKKDRKEDTQKHPHGVSVRIDAEVMMSEKQIKSEDSVGGEDDIHAHQRVAQQLLGDVRLGSLLGCGSFGRVYKATWSGAQVHQSSPSWDASLCLGCCESNFASRR